MQSLWRVLATVLAVAVTIINKAVNGADSGLYECKHNNQQPCAAENYLETTRKMLLKRGNAPVWRALGPERAQKPPTQQQHLTAETQRIEQ